MAIDRADWHWDNAYDLYIKKHSISGDLTDEQTNEIYLLAANHIGLFLRWIFDNGFEGEDTDEEGAERVRNGEISGAEYLLGWCDGKFWDVDVSENILDFVNEYYDCYFHDYTYCLTSPDRPCYSFISGDEDYGKIAPFIDNAYHSFLKKQ